MESLGFRVLVHLRLWEYLPEMARPVDGLLVHVGFRVLEDLLLWEYLPELARPVRVVVVRSYSSCYCHHSSCYWPIVHARTVDQLQGRIVRNWIYR